MSELDLAATESAVHPHEPKDVFGSEECKDSSMVSNMNNLSYKGEEEMGGEEGEEVGKQEYDIFKSEGGTATVVGLEEAKAAVDTTSAPKKKRKKRRRKRQAVRRFGPPHLNRAQVKRSKVMMRMIAFFYHLSLSILVATWTELLLEGFGNSYSKAVAFLGMCQGVERGIQFLTSASLGNLSDCLGRRPILLSSLLLNIVGTLVVVIRPVPTSVLAYFIIHGISNCVLAMLNAITGDLGAGREEVEGGLTQQFGRLGMAIGLAMMVGPMFGPSIQSINLIYPLYVSIFFLAVSVVIGFAMAESLPPSNAKMSLERSNPILGLKKALRYRSFLLFSLPYFLSQMSECVYAFIVIYAKRRLGWSYISVGLYISLLALTIAILQGNLRHVVPRFVSDKGCVLIGLLMHGVSMAVMGSAFASWMMFLMMAPRFVAGLKLPGLFSFMSRNVLHTDQGIVQGSIMSLRVLARTIGTPLYGMIFSYFFDKQRIAERGEWITGITFYVAGAFDILALLVAVGVFRILFKEESVKEREGEGGLEVKKENSGVELLEEGRREVGAKA